MRRAEWRRRADDPKGLLGWWWRGAVDAHFIEVQILACIMTVVGAILRMPWAILPTFCVLPLAWWVKLRPSTDRLRPLLPEPAPEGQFRAAVEYRRGGVVTGRDEMALTVVDGWLVGEGVRSSFALRSADVREGRVWDERMDHRERLLLTDGSEIRLRGISFDSAAKAMLDGWRRSVAAEGEPTFPPARAHEREIFRWGGMLNVGICLIFIPQGLLSLFFPTSAYAEVKIALAFAGLVLFALGSRRLSQLIAVSKSGDRQVIADQELPRSRRSSLECGDSSPLESGASSPQVPPALDHEARLRR